MICISPSHIYNSALRFSPSSSWLHQYYSAEISQEIQIVKGISFEWEQCFHTAQLDDYPLALKSWKDTIAVSSYSSHITISNTITGNQMAVLSGHTSWVRSLNFSPNGALLVSGSHDRTIKLWDMQTGGVVATFHGHTGYVYSVSISVDCATIASGSQDKTIVRVLPLPNKSR